MTGNNDKTATELTWIVALKQRDASRLHENYTGKPQPCGESMKPGTGRARSMLIVDCVRCKYRHLPLLVG